MKRDTVVLFVKMGCYLVAGFAAPLSTGLSQWANEGTWPPNINWIVIGSLCATGAASNLLAFLSSSYHNYNAERTNGNGNGNGTVKPV